MNINFISQAAILLKHSTDDNSDLNSRSPATNYPDLMGCRIKDRGKLRMSWNEVMRNNLKTLNLTDDMAQDMKLWKSKDQGNLLEVKHWLPFLWSRGHPKIAGESFYGNKSKPTWT